MSLVVACVAVDWQQGSRLNSFPQNLGKDFPLKARFIKLAPLCAIHAAKNITKKAIFLQCMLWGNCSQNQRTVLCEKAVFFDKDNESAHAKLKDVLLVLPKISSAIFDYMRYLKHNNSEYLYNLLFCWGIYIINSHFLFARHALWQQWCARTCIISVARKHVQDNFMRALPRLLFICS